MPTSAPGKIRDAARSRMAILTAAERLFADLGYDATSLGEIAAEAGLSRGTPSYFFGSKEQLYLEVIERTFAARESATRAAFAPVHAWCHGDGGLDELRPALAAAAEDYMAFLARRPSFAKLIMRDELAGGALIRGRRGRSTARQDAFTALRETGAGRGLGAFEVEEAVLLFVALTFAPISYSNTLMRAVRRDVRERAGRRRQVDLTVSQLLHLIAG